MSHLEDASLAPSAIQRPFWQRLFCRWADRLAYGQLTVVFPDGYRHLASGARQGPVATVQFNSRRSLLRLMTAGSNGFAKAYIDGDVDTPDLNALLDLIVENEAAFADLLKGWRPASLFARLNHLRRRNSRTGSRRNIAFHYDLGNAFYGHWLDRSMTYSAALYSRPGQTLEDAQAAKYERIVRQLDIGPEDHVLEIGCGWGGFAEYAAATTGCRVTGLTISKAQAAYARDRLEQAGLGERCEIRLQDYRDCTGSFSRIVSIEMFEAVGEENWPIYFRKVRGLLEEGGKAMIQVITIDETYFTRYRRSADFIQTYIFPGGMLPSVGAFMARAAESSLAALDCYRFGAHYERTLADWEMRFRGAWRQIEPLGFDQRFYRLWLYYLAYCRAGFRSGRIDVAQIELQKI
ncbi:MAG: class I SAM-dependent methyltransferase [Rhodobiaceae bacterium]|nr:class I SAM-dependent methyltransferase [Rhodobiaceae bacterium]MCC0056536.1 class I SAM-dependent methyltransferase [Rhodobiaceae bacterium]